MYSKKVMKIFHNPKHVGEIRNPDGLGKVGNPVCGDVMWVYIKVGRNKKGQEIIKDVKIKTFGCVAAIATSSIMADLVKGKTLAEAEKVGREDIVKALGGLPPIKIHCSILSTEGLQKAIEDYRNQLASKPHKSGLK